MSEGYTQSGQRRILLTGATGLIGSRLLPALIQSGHSVRAAVRSPDRAHALDCETVAVGSIGPDTSWSDAVDGCEIVLHVAGQTPDRTCAAEEFDRVNASGTRRLVDDCLTSRVGVIILMSSISGVTGRSSESVVSDATPPAPTSAYGRSKRAAELEMERFSAAGRVGMSIRLPLVYSARAVGNWGALQRLAWSGFPLPFGSLSNRRSMIGLDNVVTAVMAMLRTPEPTGGAFAVCDNTPVSLRQIVRHLRIGMGVAPRLFDMDKRILSLAATAVGKGDRAQSMFGNLEIDGSRFSETFAWMPPLDTLTGVEQAGHEYAVAQQRKSE